MTKALVGLDNDLRGVSPLLQRIRMRRFGVRIGIFCTLIVLLTGCKSSRQINVSFPKEFARVTLPALELDQAYLYDFFRFVDHNTSTGNSYSCGFSKGVVVSRYRNEFDIDFIPSQSGTKEIMSKDEFCRILKDEFPFNEKITHAIDSSVSLEDAFYQIFGKIKGVKLKVTYQ